MRINNHEFEITKGCGGFFSDYQTWICKKCGKRIAAFDDTGSKMLDYLEEEALKLDKCIEEERYNEDTISKSAYTPD